MQWLVLQGLGQCVIASSGRLYFVVPLLLQLKYISNETLLFIITHLFQNAQENVPSMPKFRMVKSLNWRIFIIILFLPQSLGYFGVLAVSGFSLGILTAAGGPVKGIAYSMNGNGEESEEWLHPDGKTICTMKDTKKKNCWAKLNKNIKKKTNELIEEYKGNEIKNDVVRIDDQGDTTDGYKNIQAQLNQLERPSTIATVIHDPYTPIEHIQKGLRRSLEAKKLCELKEAETPMPTVSDVNKQRYDPSTHKRKSKGK